MFFSNMVEWDCAIIDSVTFLKLFVKYRYVWFLFTIVDVCRHNTE